jgi:type II secretion system protein H
MPPRNNNARFARAFTLVELILVMVLLTTLMAIAVPSLARSFRQRNVNQEAVRFVALTEYARDEAVSQGVPMVVWIDTAGGRFGADSKTGYGATSTRGKEFSMNADVHFETMEGAAQQQGIVTAAEFAPDGTLDPSGVATVRVADRFNSSATISQTSDGWGYEILKGAVK